MTKEFKCNECSLIPFIQIVYKENDFYLESICENNHKNSQKILDLNEFKINFNINENDIENLNYCLDCKKTINNIEDHNSHYLKKIKDFVLSEKDKEHIEKKIKEAENFINIIKKNTEYFININNNLLKIIKSFFELYKNNQYNFQIIKNLNNLEIKIPDLNINNNNINEFLTNPKNFIISPIKYDSNYDVSKLLNILNDEQYEIYKKTLTTLNEIKNNKEKNINEEFNFKNTILLKNFEFKKRIEKHEKSIIKLIILKDKRLCSIGLDNFINIFKLDSFNLDFKINYNSILNSQNNNNNFNNVINNVFLNKDFNLVFVSNNNINILNLKEKSYKIVNNFDNSKLLFNENENEKYFSNGILLKNNNLLISTYNGDLYEFDNEFKIIFNYHFEDFSISNIIELKINLENNETNLIGVLSTFDSGIKILDKKNQFILNEVELNNLPNNNMLLINNKLFICGNTIVMMNVNNFDIEKIFDYNNIFNLEDAMILFGDLNGYIYQCDFNKNNIKLIEKKSIHFKNSAISNVILLDKFIITAGLDSKINVFKINKKN